MKILVSGSTRTVRELACRSRNHMGHLLTPKNGNRDSVWGTGLPVGVDNGAFSGFDPVSFRQLLRRVAGQPGLLWIVCPDRVADARTTLGLFAQWQAEVATAGPVALVGQDGAEDLEIPWEQFQCWFIGGSTEWKLSKSAAELAREAKQHGKWLHMGRVNTLRRLQYAYDLGCDSVDGSCFSRWGDYFLESAMRFIRRLEQQLTFLDMGRADSTRCGR